MTDDTMNPDMDKIGGFLVTIGAIKPWQVADILLAQRSGDARVFGEIAIALGYIDDAALQRYVDSCAWESLRTSPKYNGTQEGGNCETH